MKIAPIYKRVSTEALIVVTRNVVSEALRKQPNEAVIAEIAFGIEKTRPDKRAPRLADGLAFIGAIGR